MRKPLQRCPNGVVLLLGERANPTRTLALYMPCRTKTCSPCWAEYVERVVDQTLTALSLTKSERSNFSGIYLLDKRNSITPSWSALRQRLNRQGRRWVAVPLEGGRVGVLAWPDPPGAQPVDAPEASLRYFLAHHDLDRHVSSSQGLRVAAQRTATYYLRGSTKLATERIADVLDDLGLTYLWNGVDCLEFEATDDEIRELRQRIAA